jgi:hypothetical protein
MIGKQQDFQDGFEQLLAEIHEEPRRVVAMTPQEGGNQGASGSLITYYDVTSENRQGQQTYDTLVTKSAGLLERRITQMLADQQCAVPPVVIPDLTAVDRAPIFMPLLNPQPPLHMGHPQSPLTRSIADGLAGIHAANRQKSREWLPQVSNDFARRLWLYAWRERWEENMTDRDFAAEFGSYTKRLEDAMQQLLSTLRALTAEEDTLTLLNVDLGPEHIRFWRDEARFIDWEQAGYGTLYLDVPNYFTIETALIYRDALAKHGYEIPVMDFMERYHEVGRCMGLRYLGYSLWCWAQGGEQREHGRWFLYYTISLALHGR